MEPDLLYTSSPDGVGYEYHLIFLLSYASITSYMGHVKFLSIKLHASMLKYFFCFVFLFIYLLCTGIL